MSIATMIEGLRVWVWLRAMCARWRQGSGKRSGKGPTLPPSVLLPLIAAVGVLAGCARFDPAYIWLDDHWGAAPTTGTNGVSAAEGP